MNGPLAAVVANPRVDETLEALREAGVYDANRHLRSHDATAVEIPITGTPPAWIEVEDVIEQADPSVRTRTLADRLAEDGWDEAAIERAPSSWAVLGTVIVADFDGCDRAAEVGEALLSLHGNADTVIEVEAIEGPRREPSIRVVAGLGETETIHTEHGVRYAMDLATVMFAPGNKAERRRMGEVVASGETVFDMFAGIGYFSLPAATAGASVVATEINPEAFRLLIENARLNAVADRLECYLADCRTVDVRADRVVMGHYDALSYLRTGLGAVAHGGVLHLHVTGPADDVWSAPIDRLDQEADRLDRSTTVLDRRRIKGIGPGAVHGVIDVRVA